MDLFIARCAVLLKSLAARLTLLATVLGIIAAQLQPFTTDPTITRVVAFLAASIAVLAVIVRIVAHVTPVLEGAVGLLPPEDPETPYTHREAWLLSEREAARRLYP